MEDEHCQDAAGIGSRPVRTVAVDDSPSILKTLSVILELQSGVQLVGTATDGHHGIQRVLELQPDLVLMDLQLPGMNGLEATRHIKGRSQSPAVIMVTAEDTPEWRAAARAAGTDGFVAKQRLVKDLPGAIQKLFPRTTPTPFDYQQPSPSPYPSSTTSRVPVDAPGGINADAPSSA